MSAALFSRGIAALEAGDLAEAERALGAIVEREPAAHRAWMALAVAALSAGLPEIAVARAQRAVALDRRNPDYLNKLGVACAEHGDFASAEQAFQRALKLKPAYAAARHNLAKTLQKQGRLDDALREFERAYKLDPESASLQLSLCGMYRLLGDPRRALAFLRKAAPEPLPPPAFIDHFVECIADVEGADAALDWLRPVAAARPDARHILGALALSQGHWREGWANYLWRPHGDASRARPPERLARPRAALRAEQGLGDVLFFLRFAPLLDAASVELPPQLAKLAPLLAGRFPQALPDATPVWLADLPGVLQTQAVPAALPLAADGARAAAMRERLARLGPPPYAGLTWRGGVDRRAGPEIGVDLHVLLKEVPPARLGEALRGWPGTLVSLQRAPRAEELLAATAAAGAPVHDLADVNEDLQDALALLGLLDEYVAVSNTNIHLRAGLGRSARVLVAHPPEWRWMRAGESPWFPGFPLYRQAADRDWAAPLQRLRRDLVTSPAPPGSAASS